jgi:hypothetical protein
MPGGMVGKPHRGDGCGPALAIAIGAPPPQFYLGRAGGSHKFAFFVVENFDRLKK